MRITKSRIIIAAVTLLVALVFFLWPKDQEEKLYAIVKKGDFRIEVTTTGELKAKTSELIKGPTKLRSHGIWQIKILDIVSEGTYVKAGDYVAQLDKSDIGTQIIEAVTELDKRFTSLEQAKLDTTVDMMKVRDDLVNVKYDIEEKQLVFDQSTYEAPATIRQAEISLEKAKRTYDQSYSSFKIKKNQSVAKVRQAQAQFQQQQDKLDKLKKLMEELTILAPMDGMVVYKKGRDGNKIAAGDQISVWEPTVATLPNLRKMVTKTYVNEIDISKVSKGLSVDITIDAFPGKKYTGKVWDIANVGEQLPNDDAKVFEVSIELDKEDAFWRPAMTTNNHILIEELKDVLFIPQECVFSTDSLDYVVVKTALGSKRQRVELGKFNDNFVVVSSGLSVDEEVFMVKPEDVESISWR